jgi:hypothetical protein
MTFEQKMAHRAEQEAGQERRVAMQKDGGKFTRGNCMSL